MKKLMRLDVADASLELKSPVNLLGEKLQDLHLTPLESKLLTQLPRQIST
jgi:hypothetical protein